MEDRGLTYAQVRRLTGASRKALRLYEARGLIRPPWRTPRGWRRYPQEVMDEVRFIRSALAVGLRLEDLRPALEAWRRGRGACVHLLPALQRRLEEVEARFQVVARQRRHLRRLVQEWDIACPCPPEGTVCPQITREVGDGGGD